MVGFLFGFLVNHKINYTLKIDRPTCGSTVLATSSLAVPSHPLKCLVVFRFLGLMGGSLTEPLQVEHFLRRGLGEFFPVPKRWLIDPFRRPGRGRGRLNPRNKFKDLRAMEIKHGRVAMLATVGSAP